MSRYIPARGVEVESEPGSRGRVLRNKLGIRSVRAMDRAEADALLAAQNNYLDVITAETAFTAALICQMHRDWLGGIYNWAGRYRTVDMTKGGFTWPPAVRIGENMETFEKNILLRRTPCRSAAVAEIAQAMAEVQAEMILVHPFREGNGRMARWVTDLMAIQAGLSPPDYGFIGKGGMNRRKAYLKAVIAGYGADYTYLTRFLGEAFARTPEF